MKDLFYIFLLTFFLAACGNEFVMEDNFNLEELPGYVAFNAPGNSTEIEDIMITESEEMVSLNIENPTGTLSDITVNYELSGSAVLGVDYMIDGASGTSGSIVLKNNVSDVLDWDNVDLIVHILTDSLVDGQKTLTITLSDASNSDGTIAVGRGGTDLLKTINIFIDDVDCESNLEGTYTVTSTGTSTDDCCPDEITITSTVSLTSLGDGKYTISDWSGGLYFAWYEIYEITAESTSGEIQDVCNTITLLTEAEPFGESLTGSGTVDPDTGVITFTWTTGFNDTGTSVFTPE